MQAITGLTPPQVQAVIQAHKGLPYDQIIEDMKCSTEQDALIRLSGYWNQIYEAAQQGKLTLTYPEVRLVVAEAASKVFSSCFGIETEIQGDHSVWSLFWSEDNPFLNPRPSFRAPSSEGARRDYLEPFSLNWKQKVPFPDVTFIIAGQKIEAHRAILAQCSYFKTMFQRFHEAKLKEISFEGCDCDTFCAFLDFLYTGDDPRPDRRFEMLCLAFYLCDDGLKGVALSQIAVYFKFEDFFDVAFLYLEYRDEALFQLCHWCLRAYPNQVQELDFSEFSSLELIKLFQIGCVFGQKSLKEVARSLLKTKLTLDPHICTYIKDQKHPFLRQLLRQIAENMEGKEFWEKSREWKLPQQPPVSRPSFIPLEDENIRLMLRSAAPFHNVERELIQGQIELVQNIFKSAFEKKIQELPWLNIQDSFNGLTVELSTAKQGSEVARVMTHCFGIKTVLEALSGCSRFTFSWKADHALLNPKPIYKSDPSIRQKYFRALLTTPDFADASIKIGNEVIKVHRVLLAQCPLFAERLSQELVLEFQECSLITFRALLHYLYTGDFPDESLCLEMLRLGFLVRYEPLVKGAKEQLFKAMKREYFLPLVALQLKTQDPDLLKLCRWFSNANRNLEADSSLTAIQLLQMGQKLQNRALEESALQKFKEKLALDDFVILCQYLEKQNDVKLLTLLLETIMENQELSGQLQNEKKRYSEQWKAYYSLVTNIGWKKY